MGIYTLEQKFGSRKTQEFCRHVNVEANNRGRSNGRYGNCPAQHHRPYCRAGARRIERADRHVARRPGRPAACRQPRMGDAAGQSLRSRPRNRHAARRLRHARLGAPWRLSVRRVVRPRSGTHRGVWHLRIVVPTVLRRLLYRRSLRFLRPKLSLRCRRCCRRRFEGTSNLLGDGRWADRGCNRSAARHLDTQFLPPAPPMSAASSARRRFRCCRSRFC